MLEMYLGIASFLSWLAPKLGDKVVEDYFVPRLFEAVARKQIPARAAAAWKEAGSLADLHSSSTPTLYQSPAFRNLIADTFKPERHFPSPKRLCIELAFECEYHKLQSSPQEVVVFAGNLWQQWCKHLVASQALKTYLANARDKHAAELLADADYPAATDIAGDSDQLARDYFATLSDVRGAVSIDIWLPSPDGAVDYDVSHNPPITSSMFSAKRAPLGFFRKGFDYSITRDGTRLWLERVHADDKHAAESAVFGGFPWGDVSGRILWAK